MASLNPIALSALHHVHVALNAKIVERHGWLVPIEYNSTSQDLQRVYDGVGLCDISHVGKLTVHGKIEPYFMKKVREGKPPKVLSVEIAKLGDSSESSSVLVARLATDEALMITHPNQALSFVPRSGDSENSDLHMIDITSTMTGLKIAGPAAQQLLARVTAMEISTETFIDKTCAQGSIADIHGILLRLDMGHIPSYDIYVDRSYGRYVWDVLIEEGQTLGLAPFGNDALNRLKQNT